MRLPIYQVDAFTDAVFKGNPAAIVPLDSWLPDATMQAIAAENNLAETAFFVPADAADKAKGADYRLRWFTPAVEVALCGHATLASGHLLYERLGFAGERVRFMTKSGILEVARADGGLAMDFPSWPPVEIAPPKGLFEALGTRPVTLLKAPQEPERDRVVAVYDSEEEVRACRPDFGGIRKLKGYSVCITAPGRDVDFVSRYFAPNHGIDEDPVTGSNHCILIPYWARRLGKTALTARQISARGGDLACRLEGDRVKIAGRAATYLEGTITV